MAARIEAIVSDFGGVLTSPLFGAFSRVQEDQGIPLEALGKAMWAATQERGENPLFPLERGELTETEFLDIVGAALAEEVGRPVEMEGFAERYFAQLSPNQPMIDYLRACKDDGLRLALLTNNVKEWEPRWRPVWDIDSLFELVVDSGFVGMRKPDPAIYALTLERLGLPGEACIFVDDLEINCDAAREAGMVPVHFRDAEQAIAEIRAILS
jgi:putative hydrolase of the HAD superfamily